MVQTWTDDVFGETHDGITDLENMKKNFAAIKSFFSGTSEPTFTKVAGMPWYDINQKILKIRNSVGIDWVGVMTGNEDFKIWVYLNGITLQEGWGLDGSKADMVIGLKGSTRYTAGATSQGSWTLPDSDNESSHTHPGPSHDHSMLGTLVIEDKSYNSPPVVYVEAQDNWQLDPGSGYDISGGNDITKMIGPDTGADGTADGGGGSAHKHTFTDSGTWGIEAAIGIMVFPDVTA